jgi:probable rRNA maturation factor
VSIELDLQNALEVGEQDKYQLPTTTNIEQWISATLANKCKNGQLTVRIVGEDESAHLNATYRHKQGPTNVLSFPFECPPGVPLPLLGDIVVCAPVVQREAREQGKEVNAHWAHMIIHGLLHLLGYDHGTDQEAAEMENLEVEILKRLDIANPYIELEGA